MVTEADIGLAGWVLHDYDIPVDGIARSPGATGSAAAVFWLHGSPNIGSPPEPLFAAAESNGLRALGLLRSARLGGLRSTGWRTVASAAADVAAIADAFGIGKFAMLGHSGGGLHALACAALLPESVTAAVSASAAAPFGADGLDWFAGWSPGIAAESRAVAGGRPSMRTRPRTWVFFPYVAVEVDHFPVWAGRQPQQRIQRLLIGGGPSRFRLGS